MFEPERFAKGVQQERLAGSAPTDEEDRILGTGIVDTGGGYCSQGATPVHFGIPPGVERVMVEVTVVGGGARKVHTIRGVPIPMRPFQVLEIRLPEVF